MSAPDEHPDGGPRLNALVDLVRATHTDDLSPRENLGLVRLEAAWQRERARPRRRLWTTFPALATALAIGVLVPAAYLVHTRLGRVTYQVANGVAEADGVIHQTRPGTVLVFSEGSKIDVEAGARARVVSTSSDGGRVRLDEGNLGVEIMHLPNAHWSVDAGPYTIRVTGTAFNVRWSAADDRLDCQMQRGSVVITGPLIPAGVTLTAGMRLTASPRTRQLALDGGNGVTAANLIEGAAVATSAPSAPADQPSVDDARAPQRTTAPARHEAARRSAPPAEVRGPGLSWSRRLALGQFQAVLTEAEAQGLDRVLERAPGNELSALADAARYTHHAATSRRALMALRARFGGSVEARDTAFFLGGLTEAEQGATGAATSIDWYQRYLRESPTGRFVNEALGRSLVLTHTLKGAATARPMAEDYLRRFPHGPYAEAARRLLQTR